MSRIGDFFSSGDGFTYYVGKIFDTLVLGLLWVICCIPVFTIGAATTAFYYSFVKTVKNDRGYAVREFFHGFRMNFKQATILWIIFLPLIILCAGNIYIVWDKFTVTNMHTLLLVIYALALVILVSICIYLFPALSRYSMKTFWFVRFAASAVLIHFPTTLILLVVTVMFGMLWRYIPLIILLTPGVYILIVSEFMETILAKYMPQGENGENTDDSAAD